jgi:hypothetical protein
VSPVKYELGFYIQEDGVLYSDRLENLKSYNELRSSKNGTVWEGGGGLGRLRVGSADGNCNSTFK